MNEMTGLSEIKTTEIGAKSPESGSELRSAREYIKDVCAPKEYFDDNGNKYREGNELLPNNNYEINGYSYETDDKGRIVSAEGKLYIAEKTPHNNEKVNQMDEYKTDYLDTDDKGHLIGHQFGGSDKLENLVPMNKEINQQDYNKLECSLADAVKSGADVNLKVEPVYGDDSSRPSSFKVTTTIDGEKSVTVFKNEGRTQS